MTDRVTVFLDVDGVINRMVAGSDSPLPWGSLASGKALGFPIHWSPDMIEELRALDADFVWLTTWRDEARTEIAPLIGWGEDFPFLPWDREFGDHYTLDGKVRALKGWIEGNPGARFISVDDEYDYARLSPLVREWGGLPVSPNQFLGITPDDIEAMKEYIRG